MNTDWKQCPCSKTSLSENTNFKKQDSCCYMCVTVITSFLVKCVYVYDALLSKRGENSGFSHCVPKGQYYFATAIYESYSSISQCQ